MKSLILSCVILFGSAQAFAMPGGKFAGTGIWSDRGKDHPYQVEVMIVKRGENTIEIFSKTTWEENGEQKSHENRISHVMSGHRNFNVVVKEQKTGSGYCYATHGAAAGEGYWCNTKYIIHNSLVHVNTFFDTKSHSIHAIGDVKMNGQKFTFLESMNKVD